MSLLIKGMKMPEYCAACEAVNDEECICPFTGDDCEDYFGVRNRNCPLSAVPEPHGRLIDADVLHKSVPNFGFGYRSIMQGVIGVAPTIIPASEEVYDKYTDTAGNLHWTGTKSGKHIIPAEKSET